MPTSFNLPDDPVVVGATPEDRVSISGPESVLVDGESLKGPVVVDKAVTLSGSGFVVTEVVGPAKAAPRKPRPSEIKKKAAKKGKK